MTNKKTWLLNNRFAYYRHHYRGGKFRIDRKKADNLYHWITNPYVRYIFDYADWYDGEEDYKNIHVDTNEVYSYLLSAVLVEKIA